LQTRSVGAHILMVVNVEWYFLSHRLAFARALRERGHTVTVAAGVERGQQADVEAAGFRFVPIRLRRGRLRWHEEAATVLDLFRLYRAERPDLVYQTTIKPVLYGSLAARALGIAHVLSAIPGLGHSFSGRGVVAAARRPAVAAAYRMALAGRRTRVVFQTDEDLRIFVEQGIVKADRAVVIRGSGVDVRSFSPSPEPAGIPIVLLASRLLWDKGVGEFAEAARLIHANAVPCRMVIVGTPDVNSPNAVPTATLQDWHHSGLIEWWGLRRDMADVLRSAAIVALPSYYGEGVPKILLEAAASGRPIVATDWPGCRDIVRAGDNGLLVPPRDPRALADAVVQLLQDPAARAEMGRCGRMMAEREFADDFMAGQMADLCDQMLAGDARS
jgi:glycosyltransferase involved in cell wall biosynthesis